MIIRSKNELDALRKGGKILARIMQSLINAIHPGVRGEDIDLLAENEIKRYGGIPSFKGYIVRGAKMPYPASVCLSLNDEIVHGIPAGKIIRSGDIVSLDLGIEYQSFFTDMARTIIVGETDKKTRRFVDTCRLALNEGIKAIRAGVHIGDVGYAIELFVRQNEFGIVRQLVGHGVGRKVHEEPEIPNWGSPGIGPILEEGMVIAIEPMITEGGEEIKLDRDDGWTYRTKDGSRAAHFEDTVVVTKDGCEILTR